MKKSILLALIASVGLGLTGCKSAPKASAAQRVNSNDPITDLIRTEHDSTLVGDVTWKTNGIDVNLRSRGYGNDKEKWNINFNPPSQRQNQNPGGPTYDPSQYNPPSQRWQLRPGASIRPQKDRSLGAMMDQYHAENGVIGGSQLLPKPVRDSQMTTLVQWSGGYNQAPTYYFHDENKGSRNNHTFVNGQLAAASSQTWDTTTTDMQLPVRGGYQQCNDGFLPAGTLVFYGGSYNPGGFTGQQHNYYGGGGYSQGTGYVSYNPSQLPAPRGNSSNHYQTGNSHGGNWHN